MLYFSIILTQIMGVHGHGYTYNICVVGSSHEYKPWDVMSLSQW